MDLHTISDVVLPRNRAELPAWQEGDAWLAGGTWLFSEPQPDLSRLIDLQRLGWTPYQVEPSGLSLAATCTIGQLERLELPQAWAAVPLVRQCCRALLGSFKVRAAATVGGNLCMALPAGPVAAFAATLDGTCTVWTPGGGERSLPVLDFVTGPRRTALLPGEVLRRILLPDAALRRRSAFRRMSLSPNGRSGALLAGTLDGHGRFVLVVTASTRRPVRLGFDQVPTRPGLRDALDRAIPDGKYYDDVHGAPDWRQHVTRLLAEEIRTELAAGGEG